MRIPLLIIILLLTPYLVQFTIVIILTIIQPIFQRTVSWKPINILINNFLIKSLLVNPTFGISQIIRIIFYSTVQFYGLIFYLEIFDYNLNYFEYVVIMFFSVINIFSFFNNSSFEKLPGYTYSGILRSVNKIYSKIRSSYSEDPNIEKVHFYIRIAINNLLASFLRLLLSIGVFYYACFNLNLFKLSNDISSGRATFYDCLTGAFDFLPIEKIDSNALPFEGYFYDICNLVFSVIIFYWLLIFINLVLNELGGTVNKHWKEINKILDKVDKNGA